MITKKTHVVPVIITMMIVFSLIIVNMAQAQTENIEMNSNDSSTQLAPVQQRAQTLREMAKQKVKEQRQQLTDEARQKRSQICESRKESLSNKMSRVRDRGQQVKSKIDSIVSRTDDYVQAQSVSSEELTRVRQTVTDAEQAAKDSLGVARELYGDIDCEDIDNLKSVVTAYKTGVEQFKADAKDYKQAVRDYLSAVKVQGE